MKKVFQIVLVVVFSFIGSGIWYAIFSNLLIAFNPDNEASDFNILMILGELLRNTVLAISLFHLITNTHINSWLALFKYNLIIWLGFPVVILFGSVLHEGVHSVVALIHAGDWLLKISIMSIMFFYFSGNK